MMMEAEVSTATEDFLRFMVPTYSGEPDDEAFLATYNVPTINDIFGARNADTRIAGMLRDMAGKTQGFKARKWGLPA